MKKIIDQVNKEFGKGEIWAIVCVFVLTVGLTIFPVLRTLSDEIRGLTQYSDTTGKSTKIAPIPAINTDTLNKINAARINLGVGVVSHGILADTGAYTHTQIDGHIDATGTSAHGLGSAAMHADTEYEDAGAVSGHESTYNHANYDTAYSKVNADSASWDAKQSALTSGGDGTAILDGVKIRSLKNSAGITWHVGGDSVRAEYGPDMSVIKDLSVGGNATITGSLAVDSPTLQVNSTTNTVLVEGTLNLTNGLPYSSLPTGGGTWSNGGKLLIGGGDLFSDYTGGGSTGGGAIRLASNANAAYFATNAYYNGSSTVRSRAGGASQITFDITNGSTAGDVTFQTAATGNADSAISWLNAMTIKAGGNVGIGCTPGNPLAVNRQADDGVIIDLEQADTVEGTISVSGNTVSYNAFAGSHYTQLKDGQAEPPIGAVVVSTGEIIPCRKTVTVKTEVTRGEATTVVDKLDAVEEVDDKVDDKENCTEEVTQTYDVTTDSIRSETKTYAKKTIKTKRMKDGTEFHNGRFLKLKKGHEKEGDKYYSIAKRSEVVANKEYFVYIDTTTQSADKRVYGTWMGKMTDNAEGMSFGQKNKPVYLVTQVGLFKIRVTDTNGNIANGDYLETSSRAMEAQRQAVPEKRNSTIAKSLVDVDWSKVAIDEKLGYKWALVPGTY